VDKIYYNIIILKCFIRKSFFNKIKLCKIFKGVLYSMDARLLLVLSPIIVAASWVLYNIGRLALQQLNRLVSR
jgi:Photosystem II protein Y (PsbY)